MALIKCSECGKEISDKATKCIYCGAQFAKKDSNINLSINLNKVSYYASILAVVCFFLYFGYGVINLVELHFSVRYMLGNILNDVAFLSFAISWLFYLKREK